MNDRISNFHWSYYWYTPSYWRNMYAFKMGNA